MANLNIKFSHTYWKMPLEVDAETPISIREGRHRDGVGGAERPKEIIGLGKPAPCMLSLILLQSALEIP